MPNSWDGKVIATHSSINFLVQSTILQHCSVFSRPCCVVVVYSGRAAVAAVVAVAAVRRTGDGGGSLRAIPTKGSVKTLV